MAIQDRDYYFNLWKHHEDAGGEDKIRMMSLATWLLAFIVGIIGYLFNHAIDIARMSVANPNELIALSIAGILIALLVVNVVNGFSFYANFNWAVADKIAEEKELEKLKEWRENTLNTMKKKKKLHNPLAEKAPIFRTFFWIALVLIVLFIGLAIIGIAAI